MSQFAKTLAFPQSLECIFLKVFESEGNILLQANVFCFGNGAAQGNGAISITGLVRESGARSGRSKIGLRRKFAGNCQAHGRLFSVETDFLNSVSS